MIDNEENNTKLDSNALEKHQLNLHCYRIIYISTNVISVVPTHNNLTAQFNKTFQTLWRMNLQESKSRHRKVEV